MKEGQAAKIRRLLRQYGDVCSQSDRDLGPRMLSPSGTLCGGSHRATGLGSAAVEEIPVRSPASVEDFSDP